MIRLFACDLDDTLLNAAHLSDDIIKKALKQVIAEGKTFMVSTGRSCTMEELKAMGMAEEGMYNVTMNGSLIRDWNGKILYTKPVDPGFVKECWETFPEINIRCSGIRKWYLRGSEKEERKMRKHRPRHNPFAHVEGWRDFVNRLILSVEHVWDEKNRRHNRDVYGAKIEDILKEPVMKLNFHIHDEELEARVDAFLEAHADKVVNAPYERNSYEITEKDTHKGSGVKWIADMLGIGMDEIAVYGDSWNDLDMLAMFPHSYTTLEGIPKAKEIASMTLGSCANHAVPFHILKTLESEKN